MREARGLDRDAARGVDREDVQVGQLEAHGVAPVAAELVLPLAVVRLNLTIRPTSGPATFSTFTFGAGRPPGVEPTAPHGDAAGAAVADRALVERRGLVAGVEDGRVDGVAVGAARERARRVAEEHDVGERRAAERRAEARARRTPARSARPMPGGGRARRRAAQFWPRRAVVTKARVVARTGEHDVARLVAGEERAHDARRRRRRRRRC